LLKILNKKLFINLIFFMKIITRFAPSPTGYLHVGGLRTALYNFLFARQNRGKFLLRIEDTDRSRLVLGADKKIIKILKDFGLKFDNKPVYQSKRLKIYQKYARRLLEEGKAYYCFCTPQRLEKMRQEQMKNKQAPKYDKACLKLTQQEIENNLKRKIPGVIRLKVPGNKTIKWQDIIRGEISFESKDVDDQVLIKSDGFPTYHLANVVDDHEMAITYVIRGEEWLSSTPKHLLIYEAFGWQAPKYAHQSLLLNPDRSKLSKRQGDVSVEDYLAKGYLKEALLNFLAIIGWTESKASSQEIYSLQELIEKFDLKRLNKSGAVFDLEKLDWLNGCYIRQMPLAKLVKLCQPYLPQIKDKKLLAKIVKVEQERLKKISDISQDIDFFYKEPDYNPELLIWKKSNRDAALENLVKLEDFLLSLPEKDFAEVEILEKNIIDWIKKNNYRVGDMLWPMRVALSGLQNSPSPFEIAWVLGREETLERIDKAQKKLK